MDTERLKYLSKTLNQPTLKQLKQMDLVHISYVKMAFSCPHCRCYHKENDWYPKYAKSKKMVIKFNCQGCKRKINLTTDIKGDVRVWE